MYTVIVRALLCITVNVDLAADMPNHAKSNMVDIPNISNNANSHFDYYNYRKYTFLRVFSGHKQVLVLSHQFQVYMTSLTHVRMYVISSGVRARARPSDILPTYTMTHQNQHNNLFTSFNTLYVIVCITTKVTYMSYSTQLLRHLKDL